jgi:uncharacterized protein YjiS (DUF1127 family)
MGTERFGATSSNSQTINPGIIMSIQLQTLPTSVGTNDGGLSIGSRIVGAFQHVAAKFQDAMNLRRALREIESLTDRELSDIGLARDEIHRLRRGDVFVPIGWTEKDVKRETLPF